MANARPIAKGDTIVGEYRVHDIFGGEGKSGMGVVYLVTSRGYERPFVLKSFQNVDEDSLERFRLEAEMWVSIGIHPNIVQALFVDEINNQLFIGAEYIPVDDQGRNTVTHYLRQGGTSNRTIVKWAAQFCYGMEQAMSKGMKVHRDIKPDNLMVDDNGNLRITDFGLSKFSFGFNNVNSTVTKPIEHNGGVLDRIKALFGKPEIDLPVAGLTGEGSFLGTLLYASPEQIMDASKVDHRSDAYSFGIVLYQLISSGGFPYSLAGKTTVQDLALMHLQEPVLEINHPLSAIACRCLSRNPSQRYQTFSEMLHDLTRVADSMGIQLPRNRIQPDAGLRELYVQSYSYRALGDLVKAEELMTKYMSIDTMDSTAWSLKGRIEYESGRSEEAIKSTLRAYDLDKNNSKTCNNLGLFLKKSDPIKAAAYLNESIEIDPYNSGALANLAILHQEQGDHLLAADLLIRAIQIAPDKKTLHFNGGNLAALTAQHKHFDKAIELLKLLTKVDGDNTNNWFNLAVNYQATNEIDLAIRCFEVVEERLPNDELTLVSLAKLNGERGNYNEAIIYCDKLLDKNMSPLNAICWRAQYMQANGNGREAIEFLRAVIRNNEMNDLLWVTLAKIYGAEGEYKMAVAMIIGARHKVVLNGEQGNTEKMDFLSNEQIRYQRLADGTEN